MLKVTKDERGPQYIMESMNGKDVHTLQLKVFPGSVLILTRDPENVKAMFVTHASSFEIGPWRGGSFKPLLGLGLFTLRGEPWKHSRMLLRPQFSREQVSDLALEERHVDTLSSALRTGSDGWTDVVEPQPCFFKITLELMTEFLYGQSPSQMDKKSDAPGIQEFGYNFDAGKAWLNARSALGRWHWLSHSWEFSHHCVKVHQYVDSFVSAKLEQRIKSPPQRMKRNSSSSTSWQNTQTTPSNSAAKPSTSSAPAVTRPPSLLSWIFYFLSRSPEIFSNLRTTIHRPLPYLHHLRKSPLMHLPPPSHQ
ncbi:hypothetical protein OEA41_004732 [Lepraria neglecta]|uniref:Cytochrome P450 n=1 Tax=Lepraria neglecta TaxID=209136 RepID=A0AAD9YZ59_9LECA|nr:hypothetical protein OEA41_004732 [Lepraria neglecta]